MAHAEAPAASEYVPAAQGEHWPETPFDYEPAEQFPHTRTQYEGQYAHTHAISDLSQNSESSTQIIRFAIPLASRTSCPGM